MHEPWQVDTQAAMQAEVRLQQLVSRKDKRPPSRDALQPRREEPTIVPHMAEWLCRLSNGVRRGKTEALAKVEARRLMMQDMKGLHPRDLGVKKGFMKK